MMNILLVRNDSDLPLLRLDADTGESCGQYCNSPDIDTDKYRLLEDAETFLQDMQLSSNFQVCVSILFHISIL